MLQLKNIVKDYQAGDSVVHALKGISITFNEKGIVSILGPSGCGKSTLLNIIGGLDKYTSGDLLINGRSTKTYTDKLWDVYRNHSIGFIFQSYNLIPHLTLIENVELNLTIAGLTSKQKRKKSQEALKKVGLEGLENKHPNQLSGGQQQRVAIARAIVNNPDIILADEPTGALDTETSIQVMEILKKISKNKLIIMVTHNPELAIKYSDRIIKIKDGLIQDDSAPIEATDEEPEIDDKKKPSMGFWTAVKLSFKNLVSKKSRTITTGIAGSIGIIGIGLILSLSNGTTKYMNNLLDEAVTTTPITVKNVTLSADALGSVVPNTMKGDAFKDPEGGINPVKPNGSLFDRNHISQAYCDYVEKLEDPNSNVHYAVNVQQQMGVNLHMFRKYENNPEKKGSIGLVDTSFNVYTQELAVDTRDENQLSLIEQHYDNLSKDVEGSHMPKDKHEIALIVDSLNGVPTTLLDELDIPYLDENGEIVSKLMFEDIIGKEYKIFLNDAYYKQVAPDFFKPADDIDKINSIYHDEDKDKESITVKITAVLRQKESLVPSLILYPGLGYTKELTDYILSDKGNGDSQVVNAQKSEQNLKKNILTGLPFNTEPQVGLIQFENALKSMGGLAIPTAIYIYPENHQAKDKIIEYLDAWNNDPAHLSKQMSYVDSLEMTSTMLNQMMTLVTIVLSFFSGISLIVSSVMIGIITYVSVVERTKEIGVLRALGASKKNIREVFNAETCIIGFLSGIIGVAATYVFQLLINVIFKSTLGLWGIAKLPILYALLLIGVSTLLTCIAGLVPSSKAAHKDPVLCLRNE